jgi:hypothetical protein
MSANYKCIECEEVFITKGARDSHLRGECLRMVTLTDLEGNIKRTERVDGKFTCPFCMVKYSRSDNLTKHWKECRMGNERQSNYIENL